MQISSHISKSLAGERHRDLLRAAAARPAHVAEPEASRAETRAPSGNVQRMDAPAVAACGPSRGRLLLRAWR